VAKIDPNAGAGGPGVGTLTQLGFALADALNAGKGWTAKNQRNLEAALEAGYSVEGGRFPVIRDPSGRVVTSKQAQQAGRDWLARPPAISAPFPDFQPPAAGTSSPDSWPSVPVPPPIVAGVPGMGLPTPPSGPNQWQVKRAVDRIAWDMLARDLRNPKKIRKLKRRAKIEDARARAIKMARAAVKKYPKLGKVAPVLARIPKGAGPTVAVTAAYQAGYYVGTKIYERLTRPAAAGRVRSAVPVDRPRAGSSATIPPLRVPTAAALPRTRTAVARPPSASSRPSQSSTTARPAVPEPKKQPSPFPSSSPWVSTLPAPTPTPAPSPAATPWKVPKIVQLLGPLAIASLLPRAARDSRRLSIPVSAPLTSVQPRALPFSQLQPNRQPVRTDQCECPKPKKRTNKKPCRNPVIRRTKRRQGNRTFLTVTRELKCQP
jgi:hypothetical protein